MDVQDANGLSIYLKVCPMKLTDFDVLTFDCYGTLIDWESGILNALRPWAEKRGQAVEDSRLLGAFGRHEWVQQTARPGALYPDILAGAFLGIAGELGIAAEPGEAEAFGGSVKDWPAFPDSAEALAYLKRHYKLAVLSNIDRASLAHSNAKLGVEFDLLVTAQDVGSYKPAPAHFERALAELAGMGFGKEQILHTAQSLHHDHVPAKAMGFNTLWINRRAGKPGAGADKPPPDEVTPDWEVPSLAAMVELHKEHLAG